MRKRYERKDRKSNHKFEIVRGQELLVRVPLPMAEVLAEMQARVVAGLSTRNYRRAVESVVEGYGIEKSSVSRQFVRQQHSVAGAVQDRSRGA